MDLDRILKNIDSFFETSSPENIEALKQTFSVSTKDDISVEDFFESYNIEFSAFDDYKEGSSSTSLNIPVEHIDCSVLSAEYRSFLYSPSAYIEEEVIFSDFSSLIPANDLAKAC